MTPVDTAKAYCAELVRRGVRATWDPRKVVTPCILIVPPSVTFDTGCGGTGEWQAFALASTGAGNSDAWSQLDVLVAKALDVLPIERCEPSNYSLDDGTPTPSYTLAWTGQVEFETP